MYGVQRAGLGLQLAGLGGGGGGGGVCADPRADLTAEAIVSAILHKRGQCDGDHGGGKP
jgi:hypothetical protein